MWPFAERGVAAGSQVRREAYARRIVEMARLDPGAATTGRIEAAFAAIERERFVGEAPWRVYCPRSGRTWVTDDPADLYGDVLVSLGAGRGLNNGQPSLHAQCLAALKPGPGERVVHVGAGTGYYTAMLALLVGEAGRVDAYEIDPGLAARAAQNLAEWNQAAVHCKSGAQGPLPECDLLYVNAGSPQPLAAWLDALGVGGRLVFPMTPDWEGGAMLLVTRQAEGGYAARFLTQVQFVVCEGTEDEEASRALAAALARGGMARVRSLHRNNQPDETCWCAGQGWWLGMGEQAAAFDSDRE